MGLRSWSRPSPRCPDTRTTCFECPFKGAYGTFQIDILDLYQTLGREFILNRVCPPDRQAFNFLLEPPKVAQVHLPCSLFSCLYSFMRNMLKPQTNHTCQIAPVSHIVALTIYLSLERI